MEKENKELTDENFAKFPVNFAFMDKLMKVGKVKGAVRHELDENHSIRRPFWTLELSPELKAKHGVDSVKVVNFACKSFQCWAGSSIDDVKVFEFIKAKVGS